MVTLWPVRGLRPWRSGRRFVERVPDPRIAKVSFLASASPMTEKKASTVLSAATFGQRRPGGHVGRDFGLPHPFFSPWAEGDIPQSVAQLSGANVAICRLHQDQLVRRSNLFSPTRTALIQRKAFIGKGVGPDRGAPAADQPEADTIVLEPPCTARNHG